METISQEITLEPAADPLAATGDLSPRHFIEVLRRAHPAEARLGLAFDQCQIDVFCTDQALRDELASYFEPFVSHSRQRPDIVITVHEAVVELPVPFTVKQPDPGKSKIKEEFYDHDGGRIVRKRLTGMHFIFDHDQHLAIGPCQANPNQVVNFINNRFIAWQLDRGCLLGHAAAVHLHGRGLALAGFSGMGKSTLALHLMSRGMGFVSNDRLLVEAGRQGCWMSGVAKLPRVNPGTVLNNPDLHGVIPAAQCFRFAGLSPEELWDLEHKFDVDIDACFGPGKFCLSSPLHGLAILNWQRDDSPLRCREVKLRERPELLAAFRKSSGLFYLGKGDEEFRFAPERYLDLLERITVMELSGGANFELAADHCHTFLRHGIIPG